MSKIVGAMLLFVNSGCLCSKHASVPVNQICPTVLRPVRFLMGDLTHPQVSLEGATRYSKRTDVSVLPDPSLPDCLDRQAILTLDITRKA
jgi:hypothetical protein